MPRLRVPTVHRWLAASSGVALLIWTVTGLAMIVPHLLAVAPPPIDVVAEGRGIDIGGATLAPVHAVRALEARLGRAVPVSRVETRSIGGRLLYLVTEPSGARHLADAASGEPFVVDAGVAERLARDLHGTDAPVASRERVDDYDMRTPFGDLPALRISFADRPRVYYSVGLHDGLVLRNSWISRVRVTLERGHTIEQFRFLGEPVRLGIMTLFGILAVVAAVTGYQLAWRHWRRST